MTAKGHCKYDIESEDSEFRDFYEVPEVDVKERLHQRLITSMDGPLVGSNSKKGKSRVEDSNESESTSSLPDQ